MNQPNHSNYPAVSKGQLGPIITEPDSTFSANCVQNRAESAMPVLITVKPDVSAGLDSWYGSDPLEQPVIPRESMSTPHGSIECALPIAEAGHSVDSSTSSGCSAHSKSKRIRTSFTPDQLAILQANFDIEANPDGQELERIANVARLNKRVTQVGRHPYDLYHTIHLYLGSRHGFKIIFIHEFLQFDLTRSHLCATVGTKGRFRKF